TIWLVGPRLRQVMLRLLETMVAYPTLIFALVIAAVLGPGTSSAVIAIGLAGIPGFARITANLAATVMRRDFVSTAQLLGVSRVRLATRHLLPNMAEPLLVVGTTNFAATLVDISGLSFIGLGVQSPSFDFGRLLNDSLAAIYTQPLQAVGPSVMILLTGLASMLIGDGLAGSVDPRYRMNSRLGSIGRLPGSAAAPAAPEQLVSVRDLTIARQDGGELVRGISFGIGRGEILGLVGESGSGKSLTAMALARLTADELSVRAADLSVGSLDLLGSPSARELATGISIVYQDPGTTFNPALRMGPQLTEVLRSHGKLSRREADERILDSLRAVQITQPEHRLRQHPHELSGGMRQRAMIAAALANRAELIIADEPTTALDVTVQVEVLRLIREANERDGAAVLFISHDIGVVEALCDRILVMRSGEIVEELSRAQLLAREVTHPYTRALLEATPTLKYEPMDAAEEIQP
ncbi:dipeptide/oligopeptide/nickel ABC transporter permease/ATP-binding protein, partial [Leucobacter sp. M11]|uniref:dipeptide/oligopeptide/nickel ABC transporter permease/ATP-binding protein n=1 Tax=Leucobacter sp. M11 TaxID=2993565 RepID=UPI002D7E52BD